MIVAAGSDDAQVTQPVSCDRIFALAERSIQCAKMNCCARRNEKTVRAKKEIVRLKHGGGSCNCNDSDNVPPLHECSWCCGFQEIYFSCPRISPPGFATV